MCAFGLSVCLASQGCVGTEGERASQRDRLEACSAGVSSADVADNILITEEYAKALESSLTMGWLPVLFTLDFLILAGETMRGAAMGAPPDWSHEQGGYVYRGVTAAIELRIFTTEDSGYGSAGTQVTEDLFDLGSYFEDATATENVDGSVTITYSQPGPAVELLGLGPAPDNPLTLTAAERNTIVEQLSSLAIEPDYVALGVTEHLDWRFHWVSQRETIADIGMGNVPVGLDLVQVDATRDDLSQSLTTEVWDVEQRAGCVGGYTTFEVEGGHFPYVGRIDFDGIPFNFVYADRELDCR